MLVFVRFMNLKFGLNSLDYVQLTNILTCMIVILTSTDSFLIYFLSKQIVIYSSIETDSAEIYTVHCSKQFIINRLKPSVT